MGLPAKLVHSQLNFFKPLVANCSLETIRRGQDKLGELMEAIHRKDVITRDNTQGRAQAGRYTLSARRWIHLRRP